MSYTIYTPLNVWLDPASVTDVVAYIQTYLSENTIYSETEIETIIHDYLIAHPELIGGVQSVNGKTGTVVLSASDINTEDDVTIESVLASLSSQISSIAASVATNTNNITSLTGRVSTAETNLANLKSNIGYEDVIQLSFESGYIRTSGGVGTVANLTPTSVSYCVCTQHMVNAGDRINIKLHPRDNGATRWYMFLDTNLIILSKATSGPDAVDTTLIAPSDGYIVINALSANEYSASIGEVIDPDLVTQIKNIKTNDIHKHRYGFGNLLSITSTLSPESCTFVGNSIIAAFPSDVQSTESKTARIYVYTFGNGFGSDVTSTKWFRHDWGHLNTIDYSPVNDCLITTNGGSGVINESDPNNNGHIYVFPKFSTFIQNVTHQSTVNYSNYSVTVDDVTYTPIDITLAHTSTEWKDDSKYQAVWDNASLETDGTINNKSIVLISGKYGDTSRKINKARICTLGVSDGSFDETITVDESFDFLSEDISSIDFVQDMCFVNGVLYMNNSETYTELWKCTLDYENKNVKTIKLRRNIKDSNNENRWRTGLAYKDGMFAVGFSSAPIYFENIPN